MMLARRWGFLYGSWWMVQYALDGTLSFGLHIDPVRRRGDTSDYGPYMDLHLGFGAISIGRYPARAWNFSLMRPECQQ